MFLSKEKRNKDDVEVVKCLECSALVSIEDAYTTRHNYWVEYYCRAHKKPYSRFSVSLSGLRYYGEVEMLEDGTPVGYIKKPTEPSETPTMENGSR